MQIQGYRILSEPAIWCTEVLLRCWVPARNSLVEQHTGRTVRPIFLPLMHVSGIHCTVQQCLVIMYCCGKRKCRCEAVDRKTEIKECKLTKFVFVKSTVTSPHY